MDASTFKDYLQRYKMSISDGSASYNQPTVSDPAQRLLNYYKDNITPGSERKMGIDEGGTHKVRRSERSVDNFKIQMHENSMPIITGFNEDRNTYNTMTVDFEMFTNTGLVAAMRGKSNANPGFPAPKISRPYTLTPQFKVAFNKSRFNTPLDPDNLEIINFKDDNGNPMKGKEKIKDLLKTGGIIPLGQENGVHKGVYLPDFASLNMTVGLEHETKFQNEHWQGRWDSQTNGAKQFMKDMGEHYGFQPYELLQYSSKDVDVNEAQRQNTHSNVTTRPINNSKFIYNHIDPTAHGVEFSLGAATLPNMITFEHLFQGYLNNNNISKASPPRDVPNNYGMHLNYGIPHKYANGTAGTKDLMNKINSYMMLGGVMMSRAGRTPARSVYGRWHQETKLSTNPAMPVPSNKEFISMYDQKFENYGVAEMRFPHNIPDSGYVANQIIMGSKMMQDVFDLVDSGQHLPMEMRNLRNLEPGADIYSGSAVPHFGAPKTTMDEAFMNHMLDHMGFDAPEHKDLFKSFHKSCKSVR